MSEERYSVFGARYSEEIRIPDTGYRLKDAKMNIAPLLETIYQKYGYDFRNYAISSLKRRIDSFIANEKLETVEQLNKAISNPHCFNRFLLHLTVNTTDMFRDPEFFRTLRYEVFPFLQTYPFIRIWCVGCSTGEEVYSIAILLKETGLFKKCRIYATDINEIVLDKAKKGIYHLSSMKNWTKNYIKSGGSKDFSDYYTANAHNAIFDHSLVKDVVFAVHNLVTDAVFNEFHLILCRNVMIYFNQKLQNHVHTLLYDSLIPLGILCLGQKESIILTPYETRYKQIKA